jgi:hypothetical protein
LQLLKWALAASASIDAAAAKAALHAAVVRQLCEAAAELAGMLCEEPVD